MHLDSWINKHHALDVQREDCNPGRDWVTCEMDTIRNTVTWLNHCSVMTFLCLSHCVYITHVSICMHVYLCVYIWHIDIIFNIATYMHSRTFNTLRPGQNDHHFADDNFKRIFLNENARISIKISLKCVSDGPISNIPALVQIMAWRRSDDKPLSEIMMVRLLTHICVTRPQWVKW